MKIYVQEQFFAILAGVVLLMSPFSTLADTDKELQILDPVLVTANKIEEDLNKVPIAMTLISGDDLDENGIRNVDDVFLQIPNLFTTGKWTGNTRIMSIRGKTTMSFTETNPLIIYVDGIPMDTYFNADPALLSVERVEVLRGAQSTLYGKGSMGGVMNIITRKPGNQSEIKASGSLGSYESGFIRAEASGPLVRDHLFYSLSVLHDQTDGFMNNPETDKGNDLTTNRFKVGLRGLLENGLEINLLSSVTDENKGFDAVIKGSEATLDSPLNPDDFTDSVSRNAAFKIEKEFGAFRGESITTYRWCDVEYEQDFDFLGIGVGATGRHVEDREVTQEFRLTSTNNNPSATSWIAGVYVSEAERDRKDISSYIPALALESHGPNTEITSDYAAYAQITMPIMEKLSLTGALRYQHTKKDISFKYYSIMGGVTIPGLNTSADDHWDALLPKLAATWQLSEQTMTWASISQGFQPGGFNWSAGTTNPSDYTFKSQTSTDYELGLKTALFNGAMAFNANLFFSNITDLQVVSYNPTTYSYTASNAGQATSYGAEAQAGMDINRNWTAEINCALTRATFDTYSGTGTTGTFDYSGNKVPYTPEMTLGGNIRYLNDKGWTARASFHHLGKLYWDDANSSARDNITVVGARIGYEGEHQGIFLTCNNLFDERYMDYYSPSTDFGVVASPLTVALQADIRF